MTATPLVVATATDGVVHPVVAALNLSISARGRDVLTDSTGFDPAPAGAEVIWE